MRIKTKYVGGFTYIEIIISLIITAITTVLIMFVYNETQKKFYDDSMESDIAVYCDRAINEIANLLNASTETIKELPSWSGQRSYQITFTVLKQKMMSLMAGSLSVSRKNNLHLRVTQLARG